VRDIVSDLQTGQVFLCAHGDDGLRWLTLRHRLTSTHRLVLVTVVSCEPTDEIAEREYLQQYRLKIMHEGRPYEIEARGSTYVEVVPPHHPVCGDCGEVWPCREERMDRAARRFAHELDNVCAHCGRPLGGAWFTSFHDGVTVRRYHTAKKYRANGVRCVDALEAARAADPRLAPGGAT
jgi:hypothetical protein